MHFLRFCPDGEGLLGGWVCFRAPFGGSRLWFDLREVAEIQCSPEARRSIQSGNLQDFLGVQCRTLVGADKKTATRRLRLIQ